MFASAERLGFGAAASSNICQRFSNFVMALFRTRFDAEEDEILRAETDPRRIQYLRQREHLGPRHLRLYEISCYTDDPFFVCVGINRLIRALVLWHRLMRLLGLTAAIVGKRQTGASVRWLGIDWLLSAGILLVPENKRLRAIRDLLSICAGNVMSFSAYRSITGFLQYLKPLVKGLDNTYMYGMYEAFKRDRGGRLPTPESTVIFSDDVKERAAQWINVLTVISGMFYASLGTPFPLPSTGIVVHLYSDAALLGARRPGLGGFCAGLYWYISLVGRGLRLPISVLEFAAIAVNVIIFEPLVGAASVTICSDSLNSVQVLNDMHAQSPLMQFVHTRFLEMPSTHRLQGRLTNRHVFGSQNPLADTVSRGNMRDFYELCSQLDIASSEMVVPGEAYEFVENICDYAEKRGLLLSEESCAEQRAQALARADREAAAASAQVRPPIGLAHKGTHKNSLALAQACMAANKAGHKGTMQRATIDFVSLGHVSLCTPLPWTQRSHVPPPAAPREEPKKGAHATRKSDEDWPARHAPFPGQRAPPRVPMPISQPESTWLFGATQDATTGSACQHVVGTIDSRGLKRSVIDTATFDHKHARSKIGPRADLVTQSADHILSALAHDQSPLALNGDPELLRTIVEVMLEAGVNVAAEGTKKVNDLAWRRWADTCAEVGTPPLRITIDSPQLSAELRQWRETVLQCYFLLRMGDTIHPRSKADLVAKPSSSFNMLFGVRRVHAELGHPMPIGPNVRLLMKAQIKKYAELHGIDSLMPHRKEPFAGDELRKLREIPPNTKINNRFLNWDDPFFVMFFAFLATLFAAAFRKNEGALPEKCDHNQNRLSRDSVSWVICGKPIKYPSNAQLLALADGDFCVLRPPACKNDRFGLHFSWKPIYLPVNADPINAARAIARMILAIPIPVHTWAETPLFVLNISGEPLRHRLADVTFRALITAAFPGADVTKWSLHSLRIGCACALLAAHASMDLIQAVCRWRSTQSVGIYARLGAADYGVWVTRAQSQHVDTVTARRLPRIDYDGIIAALGGPVDAADAVADVAADSSL